MPVEVPGSSEGLGSALGLALPLPRSPSVALGKQLPHMTVGLAPVDDVTAQGGVHLVVVRPVREAAIWDTRCAQPGKDDSELWLGNAEAVVPLWELLSPFIEVDRQTVVHVDGSERTDRRFPPSDPKDLRQPLGCGHPVLGGNREVVEVHGHGCLTLLRGSRSVPVLPNV